MAIAYVTEPLSILISWKTLLSAGVWLNKTTPLGGKVREILRPHTQCKLYETRTKMGNKPNFGTRGQQEAQLVLPFLSLDSYTVYEIQLAGSWFLSIILSQTQLIQFFSLMASQFSL